MKEMKHTPGPWVCQTQANGSSIRHPVILSDEGAVATAQWCDNTQKTNANARMIAATPDLLEALRMWLDIHDTPAGFAGKYGKALDAAIAAQQLRVEAAASAARAAIAKAIGA